jgi:hypothetical protein
MSYTSVIHNKKNNEVAFSTKIYPHQHRYIATAACYSMSLMNGSNFLTVAAMNDFLIS